jgi:hypothetical protein
VTKKKSGGAGAKTPKWIKCHGYTLDVRRSGTEFTLRVIVQNNEYSLDQTATTGLIQHTLRVIADRWPAWDWEFQADENGTITDVR